MKKIFVTTPIYYPNDKLHIGHLYTTTIADVISRFHKLIGNEVFFTTGSDEHGQKILDKAKESGYEDPKKYVDKIILNFLELWKSYDINYDKFIRTTDKYHLKTVEKVLKILSNSNLIYKGFYDSDYCVSCEEYFTLFQNKTNNCPNCNKKLLKISEEAFFLKTKILAKWLIDYFNDNKEFIFEKTKNELVHNFLNNEFTDLCISRKNLKWAIPISIEKDFGLYVWVDALINYLSSTNMYDEKSKLYNEIWKNDNTIIYHIIGKEITRFHCIYWPMLLKHLNIRQPNRIINHGWLITKEGKMSKSKGNIIDPMKLLDNWSSDVIRFYLISEISFKNDHLFTIENLTNTYNSHLSNNFGNLISRYFGMMLKYFNNDLSLIKKINISSISSEYKKTIVNAQVLYDEAINFYKKCELDKAIKNSLKISEIANKLIEFKKPWILINEDKNKTKELFLVIMNLINYTNFLLSPVLVKKSNDISKAFGFNYKNNKPEINDNNINVESFNFFPRIT